MDTGLPSAPAYPNYDNAMVYTVWKESWIVIYLAIYRLPISQENTICIARSDLNGKTITPRHRENSKD